VPWLDIQAKASTTMPTFQEANQSLANKVKKLQEKGNIGKGKTRGLKRKATEQSTKEPSG
jgi:hypothetical protein